MHLGFKREKQRKLHILHKICLYPENGVSRYVPTVFRFMYIKLHNLYDPRFFFFLRFIYDLLAASEEYFVYHTSIEELEKIPIHKLIRVQLAQSLRIGK